jgi:SSS family solute:Na+ symporter
LGFIAPPVVAVFLVGLFWKRANGTGAFAALVAGLLLALFFIFSTAMDLMPAINDIHFLHKAPLLLLACTLVHVVFSLATPPPLKEKSDSLTWSVSIFKEETKELEGLPWYKNYRILAIILLLITAVVVSIFW